MNTPLKYKDQEYLSFEVCLFNTSGDVGGCYVHVMPAVLHTGQAFHLECDSVYGRKICNSHHDHDSAAAYHNKLMQKPLNI